MDTKARLKNKLLSIQTALKTHEIIGSTDKLPVYLDEKHTMSESQSQDCTIFFGDAKPIDLSNRKNPIANLVVVFRFRATLFEDPDAIYPVDCQDYSWDVIEKEIFEGCFMDVTYGWSMKSSYELTDFFNVFVEFQIPNID